MVPEDPTLAEFYMGSIVGGYEYTGFNIRWSVSVHVFNLDQQSGCFGSVTMPGAVAPDTWTVKLGWANENAQPGCQPISPNPDAPYTNLTTLCTITPPSTSCSFSATTIPANRCMSLIASRTGAYVQSPGSMAWDLECNIGDYYVPGVACPTPTGPAPTLTPTPHPTVAGISLNDAVDCAIPYPYTLPSGEPTCLGLVSALVYDINGNPPSNDTVVTFVSLNHLALLPTPLGCTGGPYPQNPSCGWVGCNAEELGWSLKCGNFTHRSGLAETCLVYPETSAAGPPIEVIASIGNISDTRALNLPSCAATTTGNCCRGGNEPGLRCNSAATCVCDLSDTTPGAVHHCHNNGEGAPNGFHSCGYYSQSGSALSLSCDTHPWYCEPPATCAWSAVDHAFLCEGPACTSDADCPTDPCPGGGTCGTMDESLCTDGIPTPTPISVTATPRKTATPTPTWTLGARTATPTRTRTPAITATPTLTASPTPTPTITCRFPAICLNDDLSCVATTTPTPTPTP